MIGIDEVGRGCWAGPLLVVAARAVGTLPDGLADSKVLSKKRRESVRHDITLSCDTGEGWVSAPEIDALGLTGAMLLAVARALAAIKAQPHESIIMDGLINYCAPDFINVTCAAKADALYPIVSAASIFAKVLRDEYMTALSLEFPLYGFEKHVGYGTQAHHNALKRYGVSDQHRKSYRPIQALIGEKA